MKNIDKIQASVKSYCKKIIAEQPIILPNLENLSKNDLEHIYKIAASIILTRDNIVQGGGFVQAVVNNDLEQTIGRADSISIQALKLFVIVKVNFKIKI